jgi:putative colanic acid biosynthesis UDP-glucose lipid carrier transferase
LKWSERRRSQVIVIAGEGEFGTMFLDRLKNTATVSEGNLRLIEIPCDDPNVPSVASHALDEIHRLMDSMQVAEVFISVHLDRTRLIETLMDLTDKHGVRTNIALEFPASHINRLRPQRTGDYTVLGVYDFPLDEYYNQIIKRVFDVLFTVSLIAIILIQFLILFIFIFILIKLTSKGRVFNIADRVGRKGKRFKCFKLRTMHQSQSDSAKTLTKIGWFSRRFNIDELPQFINVIKGDMSVVGPRPHTPRLADIMKEEQKG